LTFKTTVGAASNDATAGAEVSGVTAARGSLGRAHMFGVTSNAHARSGR
jgi:hypothetical protein